MAIKLKSHELDKYNLDSEQTLQVYCGLDNCLTQELESVLLPQLDADTLITYQFERGMQGPALTLMRRGFRVDEDARQQAVASLRPLALHLGGMGRDKRNKPIVVNEDALMQQYARALTGETMNPNSHLQLKKFLYESLHIEPIYKFDKGKRKLTTDHDALEKIISDYPRGEPFCRALLKLREVEKLIDVLETGVDDDGRMRCSYNISGTETGRWSSSESVFKTGTNLQNITPNLRNIFIADDGMILFNADLEQAESRAVGYLAEDEAYIRACESGDLHTTVACMVFGIEPERADELYYRHFSYRDMAKRAGHGTNYMLTPNSLARNMKITVAEAFKFHVLYLGGELPIRRATSLGLMELEHEREGDLILFEGAFPGIRRWHESTRIELETEGKSTTPFHRRRTFWGKLDADTTLREAVAQKPQSLVGDILNTGLYRVWNELEPVVQILAQGHDAITGQILKKKVDEWMPRVLECMKISVPINGRTMVIPVEVKLGHSWKDTKTNEKWRPSPLQ